MTRALLIKRRRRCRKTRWHFEVSNFRSRVVVVVGGARRTFAFACLSRPLLCVGAVRIFAAAAAACCRIFALILIEIVDRILDDNLQINERLSLLDFNLCKSTSLRGDFSCARPRSSACSMFIDEIAINASARLAAAMRKLIRNRRRRRRRLLLLPPTRSQQLSAANEQPTTSSRRRATDDERPTTRGRLRTAADA